MKTITPFALASLVWLSPVVRAAEAPEAISRELSAFLPATVETNREAISRELSIFLPQESGAENREAISREFSVFLPNPIAAPAGLVASWRGEGNALDSVGTNHGTLRNGAEFGAGWVAEAFKLDGVNDYIEVPNSTALNPQGQITVMAWYQPTQSFRGSGNEPIVDKGYVNHSPPYYQYHLGVTGNQWGSDPGSFNFSVAAGGNSVGTGTGSGFWQIGQWYHVVGTYDGSYVRIYVNGSLVNSNAASGSMTDYGVNLRIGSYTTFASLNPNNIDHLPGSVDEVAIYNRALTPAEITAIFNSGASGVDPRLPADLHLTSISVPTAASAGTLAPVTWAVSNAGPYAVTAARRDAVWLSTDATIGNDQFLASFLVPNALSVGGAQSITNSILLPPGETGSRWLVVQANYDGEINEGANALTNTAISAQPISLSAADLVSEPPSLSGAPWIAGDSLTVEWVVRNQGATNASGLWRDEVRLSHGSFTQTLASVSAPASLAAGARYTNRVTVTLPLSASFPCGSVSLAVVADGSSSQPESNEANNSVSTSFILECPPLPDLVAALVGAPEDAFPGTTAEIIWAVTNRGAAVATNGWRTQFYLASAGSPPLPTNSVLLADEPSALPLAAGASLVFTQAVSLPADFPGTNGQFAVLVDSANDLVEENETNNVALATNVTLVPATLTLTASAATVREDAGTFTVLVTRSGDRAQSLAVFVDGDQGHLLGSEFVTIPAGAASATVALQVIPDPADFADTLETLSISAASGSFHSTPLPILVRNVDQPALTLMLATNIVAEGQTVAATVARTGPASSPVTVTFGTPSPSRVLLPLPVTLAVGQHSATVAFLATDNTFVDAGQTLVQVNVSASNHAPASVGFSIVDDDLPSLTLSAVPGTFSEGAGLQAAYLTVRRAVASSRALGVALQSGNTDAVLLPPSVIIPAFEIEASVPIAAVNNALVDGPRSVVITAQARVSGTTTPVGPNAQTTVTVTDDDGATLMVSVNPAAIREGQSATGTLRRNTPATNALTVALAVDRAGEATVPPSVVIPNGAAEATFPVNALTDATSDGSQTVTLTATAPGFTTATAAFLVTDANLPDLVVTSASGPATAYVGERATLNFRVENQGVAPLNGTVSQRVFLSRDNLVGDDILVRDVPFTPATNAFGPGAYVAPSVESFAFTQAGDYWVVVQADVANAAAELSEANNFRISAQPIRVEPNFTATVVADLPGKRAPAGTPVPLRGSITVPAGQSLAGQRVDLHLTLREFRRVLSAITDATGNFATTFVPLPGEAGHYFVGAARGGESTATNHDEFTLLGAKFDPPSLTLRVDEGSSLSGRVTLRNLSDMPLSNLVATVMGTNAGVMFSATLAANSLPGDGVVEVNYVLTASLLPRPLGGGEGRGEGEFTVRVTSTDHTTNDLPVRIIVEPLRPRLTAEPSELLAGMVRGGQKAVEFAVINNGRAPTGPLTVSLPDAPWLMLSSTNPMPSLEPGATNLVTLLLTPTSTLPLGNYTGQLAVNGDGISLAVPFTFRALSDAKGGLRVVAVDEFTYYAADSPKVTNATVLIRDTLTGTNEWHGMTGTNGEFTLTNVMEGYYEIEVSAENHGSHRSTTLLEAGKNNEITAFVARETVKYTWTVEPVEIEDRSRVIVETKYETSVPQPVVTITPSVIDLSTYSGGERLVEITVANHGQIAAENFRFVFESHPQWIIEPLSREVGTLPAESSVSVPVRILRTSTAGQTAASRLDIGNGPCTLQAGGEHELRCGNFTNKYWTPIVFIHLKRGCGVETLLPSRPPQILIGLPEITRSPTTVNFVETKPSVTFPAICGRCDTNNFDPREVFGLDFSYLFEPFAKIIEGYITLQTGGLIRPDIEVDAKGGLRTCCENNTIGIEEYARASATIDLNLGPALNFDLESNELLEGYVKAELPALWGGPTVGPFDVAITGGLRVGLEAVPSFSFEGGYYKGCFTKNPCPIEFSSTVGLEFFGGVRGTMQVTASIPGANDVRIFNFDINGSVGGAIDYSVAYKKCKWTNYFCSRGIYYSAYVQIGSRLISLFPSGTNYLVAPSCTNSPESGFQVSAEPLAIAAAVFGDVPSEGICATVRIKLEQDAVLTRSAFRARLELENRDSGSLTDIAVTLRFRTTDGGDAVEFFGIRPPEFSVLNAVDGSGALSAQSTGSVSWILIPTLDAAPAGPTQYLIGGTLHYTQNGTPVTIPLADVPITVHPGPELVVDYFHQRDVFSDDPFTTEVREPSIPYSLAVMVRNVGRGNARNFRITSAQPNIVDNEKGLLIDFSLIGTEMFGNNGFSTLTPSLMANFGDIPAGTNSIARWLFTSSLQGLFTDYRATFEHLDAVAGRRLSIITNVAIHEMIRVVSASGAGADGRPDFLLNEAPDVDHLPDTVWLSDGTTRPVAVARDAGSAGILPASGGSITLTASLPGGFAYLRVPDPAGASGALRLRLVSVRRSDGTVLSPENFWQTDRTFIGQGNRPRLENALHLFDRDSTGQYTLVYEPIVPPDTAPPSSAVAALPAQSGAQIPVAWSGADNPGGSGVASYDVLVSVNHGPFTNWWQGTTLQGAIFAARQGDVCAFYSVAVDRAGNRESAPGVPDAMTTVLLSNRPPVLAGITNREISEGEEFSLTLTASDPDLPDDRLTFSLLAAPPGLTLVPLDAASAQLRWPTGEGNGPSTNAIIVSVRDNGLPSLSATQSFTLIVREVNTPPVIAVVTNRVVAEGARLIVANIATDTDLPAQTLSWSLLNNFPTNATVDAASGVFSWQPNSRQGPSTNTIRIVATDSGTPALSTTQSFVVVVRDSRADFTLALGRTNVLGGESNAVAVVLAGDAALSSVTFALEIPPGWLTNLDLASADAASISRNFTDRGAGRYDIAFQLLAQSAETNRVLGALTFRATTNLSSFIVPLRVTELSGVRADGSTVANTAATDGEVIVVTREPVLTTRQTPPGTMVLFGVPGHGYVLERATNVAGPWTLVRRIPLAGRLEREPLIPIGTTGFWRVEDFGTNDAILELAERTTNGVDVLVYGRAGDSYPLLTSPKLDSNTTWQLDRTVTLTNSFRFLTITNDGAPSRFFRLQPD